MQSLHLKSALLLLIHTSIAIATSATDIYVLTEDYPLTSFFSKFDFFSCPFPDRLCDPTNGYVEYLDQPSAQLSGLISTSTSSVVIRTDSTTLLNYTNDSTGPGRKSVRIESKNYYNYGVCCLLVLEYVTLED
jgi:hypothetical protein